MKLISATLVLILLVSSFSTSYGIIEKLENQENTETSNAIKKIEAQTSSLNTVISLDETSTIIKNQEVVVVLHKKPTISRNLILQEGMVFSNIQSDGKSIVLLKHNYNQAILQRIFNERKYLLDDGIGLPLYDDIGSQVYHSITDYLFDQPSDLVSLNFNQNLLDQFLVLPLTTNQLSIKTHLAAFDDIRNTILSDTGTALQPSGPMLLLFAFSALLVIIRSEDPKAKIQNYNRILSFVFIALLVSSAIISPLSISSSYYAHAEPSTGSNEYGPSLASDYSSVNSTEQIEDNSIQSNPIESDSSPSLDSETQDTTQTPHLIQNLLIMMAQTQQ